MRIFITIFFALILTSCGNKTYKLSDTDFEWIPYKGKDTLVFTSTTGDTDTFFLSNGKKYREYQVDPLSLRPPDSTETFDVSYKYNFFDTAQQLNNFRVLPLIILQRTKDKITKVGFSTLPEGTDFCGLKYFEIGYLDKLQVTEFETPLHKFQDVIIIEPNINCLSATKIYWSKSSGLVGFDKSNKVHYILTKKYGL